MKCRFLRHTKCYSLPFFFVIFLLTFPSKPFAQLVGPEGVGDCLAWYVTKVDNYGLIGQSSTYDAVGHWEDISAFAQPVRRTFLEEDDSGMLAETTVDGYSNSVVSMNYNPALYFSANLEEGGNLKYNFNIDQHLNPNRTIIAVLVPRERGVMDEEWSILRNNAKPSHVLDQDKLYFPNLIDPSKRDELDYGIEGMGQDLYPEEGYDEERYGKIVTYYAFLSNGECGQANNIASNILQFYSEQTMGTEGAVRQHGQIPEFIVFNKLLEEEERFRVETYLALKYGISKELDYTTGQVNSVIWDHQWWIDGMKNIKYRITGIGGSVDLNQPKSTTYYEEEASNDVDDRFIPYRGKNDYSHKRDRLLAMSLVDESQRDAPSGSYIIWGDNDGDLELDNSDGIDINNVEYLSISRKWGLQRTNDFPMTDKAWCNVVDLRFSKPASNGVVTVDSEHRRDYSRPGVSATVGHTMTGVLSKMQWTIRQFARNRNGNMIGFSPDNFRFAKDGTVMNSEGFVFGCRFNKSDTQPAPYDIILNGEPVDGFTNLEYRSGETFILTYEGIMDSEHRFKIIKRLGHSVLLEEEFSLPVASKCPITKFYGKIIVRDKNPNRPVPRFRITKPILSGFTSGEGHTNVEVSTKRIGEGLYHAEIDDQQILTLADEPPVYLLIDQDADGTFDDAIKGSYGSTPGDGVSPVSGGYEDKIEFIDVKWNSKAVFTFGKRNCEIPLVNLDIQPTPVAGTGDECCGGLAMKKFQIEGCDGTYFYEVYNAMGERIGEENWSFTIEGETKEVTIPENLANGSYTLIIIDENCKEYEYEFEINVEGGSGLELSLIPEIGMLLDDSGVLNIDACPTGMLPMLDFVLSQESVIATNSCVPQDITIEFNDDLETTGMCPEQWNLTWTAIDGCGESASLELTMIVRSTVLPRVEGLPDCMYVLCDFKTVLEGPELDLHIQEIKDRYFGNVRFLDHCNDMEIPLVPPPVPAPVDGVNWSIDLIGEGIAQFNYYPEDACGNVLEGFYKLEEKALKIVDLTETEYCDSRQDYGIDLSQYCLTEDYTIEWTVVDDEGGPITHDIFDYMNYRESGISFSSNNCSVNITASLTDDMVCDDYVAEVTQNFSCCPERLTDFVLEGLAPEDITVNNNCDWTACFNWSFMELLSSNQLVFNCGNWRYEIGRYVNHEWQSLDTGNELMDGVNCFDINYCGELFIKIYTEGCYEDPIVEQSFFIECPNDYPNLLDNCVEFNASGEEPIEICMTPPNVECPIEDVVWSTIDGNILSQKGNCISVNELGTYCVTITVNCGEGESCTYTDCIEVTENCNSSGLSLLCNNENRQISEEHCSYMLDLCLDSEEENCANGNYNYELRDSEFELVQEGYFVNNILKEPIRELPAGQYQVIIYSQDEECDIYIEEWVTVESVVPLDAFADVYCLTGENVIIPNEDVSQYDCVINWEGSDQNPELGLNQIHGLEEGQYRVDYISCEGMGDCSNSEGFDVSYCSSIFNVRVFNCPNKNESIEITTDDLPVELATIHLYRMYAGGSRNYKIYSASWDSRNPLLLDDLPEGDYKIYVSYFKDERSFVHIEDISIDYDTRIPSNFIKIDTIILNEEQSDILVDAGLHVYGEVEYLWYFGGELISQDRKVDLHEGTYDVIIKSAGCEKQDRIVILSAQEFPLFKRHEADHDQSMIVTYRNPIRAHEVLQIKVRLQEVMNVTAEIYDASGRLMSQYDVDGRAEYTLSANLSSGLYFLKVNNGEEEQIHKIAVQ